LSSAEVVTKRRAAGRGAKTATSSWVVETTWTFLLLGEQDIEEAQGSWEFPRGTSVRSPTS
jgi:type III restriction enzyme